MRDVCDLCGWWEKEAIREAVQRALSGMTFKDDNFSFPGMCSANTGHSLSCISELVEQPEWKKEGLCFKGTVLEPGFS